LKYINLILLILLSCRPNTEPTLVVKDNIYEEVKPIIPQKDNSCKAGMIYIHGTYCTNLKQTCLKWIDKKRCKSFSHESICEGSEIPLDFCIDTEEAHSENGMPLTNITWNQGNKMCKSWGKRLCTESEWTLSCEGNERLPYPYGYDRDSSICNIDHKAYIKNKKLVNESVNIKSYPDCLSPYKVHDMVGNVDEAVVSNGGTEYKSVFKGGFWGYIRGNCFSRTTEHFEEYADTQTGFRCCSNINDTN
jgi:sulfatase modifying factor 1